MLPAPSVHELLISGDVDRAKRLLNDDLKLINKRDDVSRESQTTNGNFIKCLHFSSIMSFFLNLT